MNKPFSVYLDAVRFLAACLVYLYHSNQRRITAEVLPLSDYGHSAVIVFFVLSGFVIAYVTNTKERHWVTYAASRFSRVASVAIPAIVLTLLLDTIGRQMRPELYTQYPFDQFLIRSIAAASMANEIWGVSITTFSNVPYWSIGYESWYYVIFGLAVFVRAPIGYALAALVGIALGPKIVLLAPIWLSGVALYRWRASEQWPVWFAGVLAVLSASAIVAFHRYGVEPAASAWLAGMVGESMHRQMTFSKFFLSDYLLATLVFLNFAAMRRFAPSIAPVFLRFERPIRNLAAYTFTLYLLHQPLFLFWGAMLGWSPQGRTQWIAITGLVAASVWLVGSVTEHRRYLLKDWVLQRLARWSEPKLGSLVP